MSGLAHRLLLVLSASSSLRNDSFIGSCLEVMTGRGKYHKFQHIYISTLGSGSEVSLLPLFAFIPTAHQSYSYSIQNTCLKTSTLRPNLYISCLQRSDTEETLVEIGQHISAAKCRKELWDPRSRGVFILQTQLHEAEWKGIARRILQKLWMYNMYNVAVLVSREPHVSGMIFMAHPFHPQNVCGKDLNVMKVETSCTKKESSKPTLHFKYLSKRAYFPNCTFRVSVREEPPFSHYNLKKSAWVGSDVKLLSQFRKRVGLNFKFIPRESPLYESNCSVTSKYYDQLKRNELDLAIGGTVIQGIHYDNITYLKSHFTQGLTIFVAPRSRISNWHVYYLAFSKEVWIGTILIFLICFLLFFLNRKFSVFDKEPCIDSMLRLVGIILQTPQLIPQKLYFRFFFAAFLLFSYVLSSMYSSNLRSLSVNPPYSAQIDTISQLKEANFSIWMNSNTWKFIKGMEWHKDKHYIIDRAVIYDNLENAIKKLYSERNFAILERNFIMLFKLADLGYPSNKISYTLTQMNVAFAVPKGSLFSKRLNLFIDFCVEHGLSKKWIMDMYPKPSRSEETSLSDNLRKLSIVDLYPAFVLLLIGLSLSTCCFIGELLYHKIRNRMDVFEATYDKLICILSPPNSAFRD